MTMSQKDNTQSLLIKAAKQLNADGNKRLQLMQALISVGLPITQSNRNKLRVLVGRAPRKIYREIDYANTSSSMPLGKETLAKGWQFAKTPGVYAIICKGSGKRYIGSSSTPWLRRAVHLYWLKNYWKYGGSNVFFGNLDLKSDVEKYGVDSFYMEIIKSMPGADRDELERAEFRIIKTLDKTQLYNRGIISGRVSYITSSFSQIEPEFHELQMRICKQHEECVKAETRYSKYYHNHLQKMEAIRQRGERGEISKREMCILLRNQTKLSSVRREQIKAIRKNDLQAVKSIRIETKKLVKKYTESSTPLY